VSRALHGAACTACGQVVYPARLLCPRCSGSSWQSAPLDRGVVEETTVRRRRVRADRRSPHADWGRVERVALASVRTEGGPVVTARLFDALEPGTEVRLTEESGAPVARPATA
jgi:uncharacterized OB-fold protein